MRDCVALGNVAQNFIAVQLADNAQLRRRGNVRQDERKADLLQHAVRHRVVGFRFADDALQIESLVEVERRQAKEARAVAPYPADRRATSAGAYCRSRPGTRSLREECPMVLPSTHHASARL